MNQIKAILFDLDNTLIDRTATVLHFLKDQYKEFDFINFCNEEDYLNSFMKYDNNGYAEKLDIYGKIVNDLKIKKTTPETLLRHFKENYPYEPILFPEVKQELQKLKDTNLKIAIVSNGRTKGQNLKIKKSGIKDFFDFIVISEEFGAKKPEISIYNHALSLLDMKPGSVLFVGDHPKYDVEMPRSLGMKAIWRKGNYFDPPTESDANIDNLSEISEFLKSY